MLYMKLAYLMQLAALSNAFFMPFIFANDFGFLALSWFIHLIHLYHLVHDVPWFQK